MRRVTKLEGTAPRRDARPTFTLPDGDYIVPTGDGETIRIHVSHGPAATAVTVGMAAVAPTLRADVYPVHGFYGTSGQRLETRQVEIAYYSPRDAYAQAFAAWYDARSAGDTAAEYPGPREAFEARQ